MERVNKLREEQCTTYPTWMMKDDKPFYKSESINGQLFNKVQNLAIDKYAYKLMYMKYDKINKDISITMEADDDMNKQHYFRNKRLSNFYQSFIPSRYFSTVTTLFYHKHRLIIIIICLFIYFIAF
jgi:hypothetical protein